MLGSDDRPSPEGGAASFCGIINREIVDGLKIRPEDTPMEQRSKLRLHGYHRCICENDCPEGSD